MFGISVYLKDMDEHYIKKASENGAKYIFTSLHIPEEDLSQASSKIKELLVYCEKYNMNLVPDVSPVTFEKLGVANGNFEALADMGIRSIRLDYGFDDLDLVGKLQESFDIMLNASVVSEKFINECLQSDIDLNRIIAVHNFYPKHDTGLSKEYYKELNRLLKQHNIKILTFVIGDKLKRFPLYEGLPTIEAHRTVNPYVATVELVECLGSTGVMIGDSMATDLTLSRIHDFLDNKKITIPVYLDKEYDYLYNDILKSRRDLSDTLVRVTTPRTSGIAPRDNGSRTRGSILILNELAGRYCGELQLCKQNLSFSVEGNTIGFVEPEYVEILEYINSDYEIIFVPIGGE